MRSILRLITLLVVCLPFAVSAEPYQLGVSDVVRLRVMDWQPVDREIREWTAMAGEFTVAAEGTITVPFVGTVVAEGRTPEDIGAEIATGLQQRFALPESPDAIVEIASYRPVIVAGLVRSPGEYAFRPGMTAQQAIGIAGGLSDLLIGAGGDRRALINSEGSLQVMFERQRRLIAKSARLRAEQSDSAEIEMPAELEAAPNGETLLSEEAEIKKVRESRLDRELQAITAQQELLRAEIESLESKTAALERQREIANTELENARKLSDRGLMANSRLFDVERSLSTVENQLLDTSTAMLRARQGVASADRDRVMLIDGRSAEITQQLQDVTAELAEIGHRIETEAALSLTGSASITAKGPEILVQRQVDGEITRLENAADLTLRPGDYVEVTLPETEVPGTDQAG